MYIRIRKTTSLALLASIALISTLGDGLHAIPGAPNHSEVSACSCGFSHGTPSEESKQEDTPVSDSDECLVCRLLAQSFEQVQLCEVSYSERHEYFYPTHFIASLPSPWLKSCLSRGPPVVAVS